MPVIVFLSLQVPPTNAARSGSSTKCVHVPSLYDIPSLGAFKEVMNWILCYRLLQ